MGDYRPEHRGVGARAARFAFSRLGTSQGSLKPGAHLVDTGLHFLESSPADWAEPTPVVVEHAGALCELQLAKVNHRGFSRHRLKLGRPSPGSFVEPILNLAEAGAPLVDAGPALVRHRPRFGRLSPDFGRYRRRSVETSATLPNANPS